eukprot:231936_1
MGSSIEKESMNDNKNGSNADDMKWIEGYSDDSDGNESDICLQEMIVTGLDQRKPIYEAECCDTSIIDCIGEITAYYKESQHMYQSTICGTGTVFHCDATSNKHFIITAAHNVRHLVKYCQQCDSYMDRAKMSARNQCVYCKTATISSSRIIKAKRIEFRRR